MNIEKIVNDFLLAQRTNEKHTPSGLISASILGQCHRRQFYYLHKIESTNPPDERALRIFQCGNLFHQFVQDIIIKQEGVEVEKVYKDDRFSIRVDLLDNDTVYELKSMHSRGFWNMDKQVKEGKSITDIKPEHCLQVGLGAMLFKKKQASLVYISKDDLCVKQFVLNAKELKPKVEAEIKSIESFQGGQLPPPEPRLYPDSKEKNKECVYCQFKDRCFTEREV